MTQVVKEYMITSLNVQIFNVVFSWGGNEIVNVIICCAKLILLDKLNVKLNQNIPLIISVRCECWSLSIKRFPTA